MGLFVRKLREGGAKVSRRADFTAPPPEEHHFSPDWVMRGVSDGLVSLANGQIVIHRGEDNGGDLAYDIVRPPGAYCLHCGDQVGEGPSNSEKESLERIAYVETCQVFNNDDETGDPSDPVNRYEVANYYLGRLAQEA